MNESNMSRADSGRVVVSRVPGPVRKGGALARDAALMCATSKFQEFAVEQFGAAPAGVSPEEHAAAYLRAACAISSRAELDHDSNAEYRFHQRVRKPFLNWQAVTR